MEQPTTNIKKWGWWAIVGLVAIIVIAGLIIAISLSGPKPSDEIANPEETSEQDTTTEEPATSEEDKPLVAEVTPELPTITESPENLPKTGPEDIILPALLAGLSTYILALTATTIHRNHRRN
ncbi:MAG: hypothetical protein LBT19_01420 [Candidatus Nomurabacteria bacterium]|jgi:hypothetical protein|nr:hypothetical protein [Candidatus Nomurabacteria bacterium]